MEQRQLETHYETHLPGFYPAFKKIRFLHNENNKSYELVHYDQALKDLENEIKEVRNKWSQDSISNHVKNLKTAVQKAKLTVLGQERPTIFLQFLRPYPKYFKLDRHLDYLLIVLNGIYQELAFSHSLEKIEAFMKNFLEPFTRMQSSLAEISARVKYLDEEPSFRPKHVRQYSQSSFPQERILPATLGNGSSTNSSQKENAFFSTSPAKGSLVNSQSIESSPLIQDESKTVGLVTAANESMNTTTALEAVEKSTNNSQENTLNLQEQEKLKFIEKLKSYEVFSDEHLNLITDLSNNTDPTQQDKVSLLLKYLLGAESDKSEITSKEFQKRMPLQLQLLTKKITNFELTTYHDSLKKLFDEHNDKFKEFAQLLSDAFKIGTYFQQNESLAEIFKQYAEGHLDFQIASLRA